ncbi:RDD family protein [uncultured Hymenobacter sp.]|uniref:RDD family protein n=1 Tax=uncultured Hymenobacter sp. TaxID=170016 RepID=UPI0035CC849B
MATIRVQTTQNVTLEYETASVGDRLLATLIDYALYIVWFIFFGVLRNQLGFGLGNTVMLLMMAPTTFYFLLCEVLFNGQSLGKKARDLRVVRLDGTRPGLGDYLLRWLLRPLEIVACLGGVAILTILLNGRGQRLGDLAAGTTVISLRRRPTDFRGALATELPPPGYQVVFPQAAQLSDHDAALLRQLLYQSTRKENYLLLNETANKVKALTGIHTDLRDEAFLRTVLRDHAHLVAHGA